MKTRGIILAMVLGAFLVIPLNAQWAVGGFLTFNVAGISVKPDISTETYSSILGMGIGGIATYPLMNGLAVQAEPMLVQKGFKISEFGDNYTVKILYFDVPVFIRYNIPAGESIIPYAILGPNLGFRASAKVIFDDGSSEKINEDFSSIDFGMGLGGGVEVPYENLIFFGEVRYVLGLTDINAQPDESKVKNRGLQVLLGVKVPL